MFLDILHLTGAFTTDAVPAPHSAECEMLASACTVVLSLLLILRHVAANTTQHAACQI